MRVSALLAILVTQPANGSLQVLKASKIVPALHPESDKKFFGKDYPDDLRPKVVNHFDHPYPTVQDSGEYDKDYVKDENNDNGEWTAQMEYDRLKNMLAREREKVMKAKAKMEEERWEYEQVKKFEADAEEAARKAEGDSMKAAAGAAGAEGEAGDGAADVGSKTSAVEQETDSLKGCEKELAYAKKMLRNLKDELASVDGGVASAFGKFSEAEAYARKLESQEASLEKQIEGEMLSYDQLVKLYKVSVHDLEELETDVDKAAKVLKIYQAKDPGARDGVIGLNAHSAASPIALPSMAILAAFAGWTLS